MCLIYPNFELIFYNFQLELKDNCLFDQKISIQITFSFKDVWVRQHSRIVMRSKNKREKTAFAIVLTTKVQYFLIICVITSRTFEGCRCWLCLDKVMIEAFYFFQRKWPLNKSSEMNTSWFGRNVFLSI